MPELLWCEAGLPNLTARVECSAAPLEDRLRNLTGGSATGAGVVLGSSGSAVLLDLAAALCCFLALMEAIWPLKQAMIFLQMVQEPQQVQGCDSAQSQKAMNAIPQASRLQPAACHADQWSMPVMPGTRIKGGGWA